METNTADKTLKKNYIQKYQFLIQEYERVKQGAHPSYRRVHEFYKAHGTCAQTFLKYYARYQQSGGNLASLLPQKRGPHFKTRRADQEVESLVLAKREAGCNKYEITHILRPLLHERTPSPSGVYNILKRHGKNRMSPERTEERQRIIKEKAGELAHIDCHHLSKDTIADDPRRYYLVCVLDDCTRVAWAEVVEDIQSLTVMFSTLRCMNQLMDRYQIKFQEVLTDNGPEFGPKESSKKRSHPFERMLIEMGITHRYTRPYRPQTNGKVERFWRSMKDDLVNGTYFESIDAFKQYLFEYLLYYNQLRPHQGLQGKTPATVNQSCQRIT